MYQYYIIYTTVAKCKPMCFFKKSRKSHVYWMSDPEYILLSNSIRRAEKSIFKYLIKVHLKKCWKNTSFSNLVILGHIWSFEANFGILDFYFTIVHVHLLGTLETRVIPFLLSTWNIRCKSFPYSLFHAMEKY